MRLFLSSYGIGNHPEKLIELIGVAHPRAALVSNAADYHDKEGILERVDSDKVMFREYGITLDHLDLKDYFGTQDELAQRLRNYDLIWVRGGNAFVLRRAMAYSGFDQQIKKLLTEDVLVYGGYSAGACVLSPSLRGVDLCDDPTIAPANYKQEVLWDGLGLVDFSIAPHYKSDHPEAPLIDRVVEYFDHNNVLYKTLRDGEAIVINGEKQELLK